LPVELKRNLLLMRELDEKAQFKNLREVDQLSQDYITNARSWIPEKRSKVLEEIHGLFTKTKSLGDEKISIALQTYEMVDKHIRRLDNDLARFEGELTQKLLGGGTSMKGQKKRKLGEKASRKGHTNDDDETPRPGRRKKDKTAAEDLAFASDVHDLSQLSGPQLIKTLTGEGGDTLDMPVDPNEPTYCLCHQVSYGEMIGCDNADCPIEWFHFGCVGLNGKPKGKWYCPKCREERTKK